MSRTPVHEDIYLHRGSAASARFSFQIIATRSENRSEAALLRIKLIWAES